MSLSVCMCVAMCVKAGQRLLDAPGLFSIYGPPSLLQSLTFVIQNTLLDLLLQVGNVHSMIIHTVFL